MPPQTEALLMLTEEAIKMLAEQREATLKVENALRELIEELEAEEQRK